MVYGAYKYAWEGYMWLVSANPVEVCEGIIFDGVASTLNLTENKAACGYETDIGS